MPARSTRECRADSWDEFVAMVQGYGKKHARRMAEDFAIDGRLGMIVRLANDWCQRSSDHRAEQEVRNRPIREARAESMRLRVENLRPYVDEATRRQMPRARRRRNTPKQRSSMLQSAWRFFRKWDHASPEQIQRATQRAATVRLWALTHPYGGPVPGERVRALVASIRECCPPATSKRSAVEPAGMTPERALQIAMLVLR